MTYKHARRAVDCWQGVAYASRQHAAPNLDHGVQQVDFPAQQVDFPAQQVDFPAQKVDFVALLAAHARLPEVASFLLERARLCHRNAGLL
eukprot:3908910-Rhodomonas_salina.1